MDKIYVCGHKNPDTDSAVSAVCYAAFKTLLNPDKTFIPIVCGNVKAQTKFIFDKADADLPLFLRDIHPRVTDAARHDGMRLYMNEPVFEAVKDLDENTLSVIPVFHENDNFAGIVGIHEIVKYMMSSEKSEKKKYIFNLDNIASVIPGRFFSKSDDREFTATLMVGAMDEEYLCSRIFNLSEKPVLIVGKRTDIIKKAAEFSLPAIILTNISHNSNYNEINELKNFKGSIYFSEKDTAETIRLLWLSAPIKHIVNSSPFVFQHDRLFDEAKKILLSSDIRGVAVLNNGIFGGVVTRRSFIEKPKYKLIMVDHNETSQSVNGSDEADIIEIIDHHRFAADKTSAPIYIYSKPVGSTATLVCQHFKMSGFELSRKHAVLLLGGILSDTLFLKSPTTTIDDISAADFCSKISGIDIQEFSNEIKTQMPVLKDTDPSFIAGSDFKKYSQHNISFGISQFETSNIEELKESFLAIMESLIKLKNENNLDFAMILITDVISENSKLISTDYNRIEERIIYEKESGNTYNLPGVLSRKKQLLPEVLRCIEESL